MRLLGFDHAPKTVRTVLAKEAATDDGRFVRLHRGVYRLRTTVLPEPPAPIVSGRSPAAPCPPPEPGRVLAVRRALTALLPTDASSTTCTEIAEHLHEAGIGLSGRSVRLAVAELIAGPAPEFGRMGRAGVVRVRPAR
jgi:hypothetical protein